MLPCNLTTDKYDRPLALSAIGANGTPLELRREREDRKQVVIVVKTPEVTFQQLLAHDMQSLAIALKGIAEAGAPFEATRYTEWEYEQTLKLLCW